MTILFRFISVFLLGLLVSSTTFVSADGGVLSYDQLGEMLSSEASVAVTNDSPTQLCTWTDGGATYTIAARCLVDGQLPSLGFEESLDYLRPHIVWFDTTYDTTRASFAYRGDSPDMEQEFGQRSSFRFHPRWSQVVQMLAQQERSIILPKNILASRQADRYFFAATPRRLAGSSCTQTNYLVALASLDRLMLAPGATLNLNRRIEYLPGYCKGKGNQTLMFFGGVCGVSSQLFRTSLLSDMLTVTQRAPHSEWYTQYYTDAVRGDDAAIYQMSKQFEIRNDAQHAVMFRTLQHDDIVYLIMVAPQQPTTYTMITKSQTGPRSATVIQEIYDRVTHSLIKSFSRSSKYTAINTSWF